MTTPLTNACFLANVSGHVPPDQRIWTTAFKIHPNKARSEWAGGPLNSELQDFPDANTYFCVSTIRYANGATRRDKEHFAGLQCVVIDDAVPAGELSWVLETSPNNYQAGYILAEPVTDIGIATRLHEALARAGKVKADTSGNNPVRYVRLPVGTNTKYDPPFRHRMIESNLDRVFTLDEIIDRLGLDADYIVNGHPAHQAGPESTVARDDDAELIRQVVSAENYHDALLKLTARYASRGIDERAILAAVRGFMQAADDRSERWQARMQEVERMVRDGIRKFGQKTTAKVEKAPFVTNFPVMTAAQMIERFILLTDGSRVFDRLYPGHTLSFQDFRNATSASTEDIDVIDARGKMRTITKPSATLWLSNPNRITAVSSTFKAGEGMFVIDPNGRHCVNMWSGWQRDLSIVAGDPALFVEHVRFLFKERSDDFLDWLAHIEQFPGVLPHTAWVHIASRTGIGRNLLAAILEDIWAGYVAEGLDLMILLERGWNERLSRRVLATVDEIKAGGSEHKWKHAELLKQMVTAKNREISAKYGRAAIEHNACRFLIFSNHRAAIPIDDADRRFDVVINDGQPMGEDYYRDLIDARKHPAFIAGIVKLLQTRDISGFNPGRHAKKSAAKEQVIATNRSAVLSALMDFTANYPFELVTHGLLHEMSGIDAEDAGAAARIGSAIVSAGWMKLARVSLRGKRSFVYVRQEAYESWKGRETDIPSGLPVEQGGQIVPR